MWDSTRGKERGGRKKKRSIGEKKIKNIKEEEDWEGKGVWSR